MQLFYIKLYYSKQLYVSWIIHASLFFCSTMFDSYVWQVLCKTIYRIRQSAKASHQRLEVSRPLQPRSTPRPPMAVRLGGAHTISTQPGTLTPTSIFFIIYWTWAFYSLLQVSSTNPTSNASFSYASSLLLTEESKHRDNRHSAQPPRTCWPQHSAPRALVATALNISPTSPLKQALSNIYEAARHHQLFLHSAISKSPQQQYFSSFIGLGHFTHCSTLLQQIQPLTHHSTMRRHYC